MQQQSITTAFGSIVTGLSIARLAPASVVYAGSASKTLAPGLRLGWLVAPPALAERMKTAVRGTGAVTQR